MPNASCVEGEGHGSYGMLGWRICVFGMVSGGRYIQGCMFPIGTMLAIYSVLFSLFIMTCLGNTKNVVKVSSSH